MILINLRMLEQSLLHFIKTSTYAAAMAPPNAPNKATNIHGSVFVARSIILARFVQFVRTWDESVTLNQVMDAYDDLYEFGYLREYQFRGVNYCQA